MREVTVLAQIHISVENGRLFRMLTLLCLDAGHTVGEKDAHLLITDTPTDTHLPVLLLGEGGLALPFSIPDFHARLTLLLSAGYSALTPTERRLLDALRDADGAPVPREELMRRAFGTDAVDGRLNLYIHYLREKLETDGKKRIFACRGKGYYYHAENRRR